MNRRFALLAGSAALLGGGYAVLGRGGVEPGVTFGSAAAQEAAPDTSRVVEMTLGDPNAPVTVIEYASFTCPHCKAFHDGAFGDLKANYIDTGKVHFIYREVYFDRFGLWAAMVARCGGPERYFGISDLLYEQQRDWLADGDPATIADNLRKIGRTAGLTDEQVDACLQDRGMAEAMVAVYQENAERDGVDSTPSFLINGKKHSNMSYADFAAILDEELAG
ncbi:DsbA family protein [Palleronia sp. KMU-117]|uniref:DsbA family protein n=1 Tax=Palleronia sp. KMU-117 TaxID=3434108 RepID=UPI003D740F36